MRRADLAALCAVAATAGVSLLLPDGKIEVTALLLLLGFITAGAIISGYGGRYLLICLGEAYAVGLGAHVPLLGIAFQPVIAGIACRDDRKSLVIGGVTMTVFSAGVLLFKYMTAPLMVMISVLVGFALFLIFYESRLNRRLSWGDRA